MLTGRCKEPKHLMELTHSTYLMCQTEDHLLDFEALKQFGNLITGSWRKNVHSRGAGAPPRKAAARRSPMAKGASRSSLPFGTCDLFHNQQHVHFLSRWNRFSWMPSARIKNVLQVQANSLRARTRPIFETGTCLQKNSGQNHAADPFSKVLPENGFGP